MDIDKTTILLPPKLRKDAAKRAAQLGISLGELIRRKLLEELGQQEGSTARSSDPIFKEFDRLVKKSGVKDLSLHHDDYLYDKS